MMGPGMQAWVLIMVLALALILPAMLALLWRGRDRAGLEPKAKRKRREDDIPDEDALARLEAQAPRWLEDDGELPEDLGALLNETEKPKHQGQD